MPKIPHLDIQIAPLTVYLCTSQKQFNKLTKQLGISSDYIPTGYGASTLSAIGDKGDWVSIISIEYKELLKTSKRTHVDALLAHECLHVTQFLVECMHANDTNGELEAYTMQTILTWALDQIHKEPND